MQGVIQKPAHGRHNHDFRTFDLKPSLNDADSIFASAPASVDFEVIDLLEPGQGRSVVRRRCNGSDAGKFLGDASPGVKVRIISIPGLGTTSPLCITRQVAASLIANCKVEPEFEHIFKSFGKAPNAGHGGCTHAFVKRRQDGSVAVGYQLQYIEENGRGLPKPWSHRQVGVYHRSCTSKESEFSRSFDFFLILHSTFESSFATKLKSILVPSLCSKTLYASLIEDPSTLHGIFFEGCMDYWHHFLEYMGNKFEHTNDRLSTIEEPTERPSILNFEEYRHLRHSRDEMLIAKAYCKGQEDAIKFIYTYRRRSGTDLEVMAVQTRIQGYCMALTTLLARLDNCIALFQYSLGLQNEAINFANGENTLDLARTARDESTEIRIITIISLFFIPGSFLAGWFNLSFFTFNTPSNSWIIAEEFSLYVALWIPLTLVTLGMYRLYRYYLTQKYAKETLRFPRWRPQKKLSV